MTAATITNVTVEAITGAPRVTCEVDDKPAIAIATHAGCEGYRLCDDHREKACHALASHMDAWGCPKCGLVGPRAIPSAQWQVLPI